MCFLVEFWDVDRQPQPPIKPHSEPYIDFEWPLQGWCIDLPQVYRAAASTLSSECCQEWTSCVTVSNGKGSGQHWYSHCKCNLAHCSRTASSHPKSSVVDWAADLAILRPEGRGCLVQNSRSCLLRSNTADQMLDVVFPAFPKLGVKIDDIVIANFAMWHNL